jgi:monomeric isocitrate dehydrogenase
MIESSELIEKVVKNKAFDPMPMGGEVNSTLIARRAAEYALAKLQTAVQWERLEEQIRQHSNSPNQQQLAKVSRTTISKTNSNQ